MAAATWWPTSASWVRRTGSTSCRAAHHVVHVLGRTDVAFVLMGGGDSYADLVAQRDRSV